MLHTTDPGENQDKTNDQEAPATETATQEGGGNEEATADDAAAEATEA